MNKDSKVASTTNFSSANCCAASAAASNEASNLYQVNLVEPTGQESFYTITRWSEDGFTGRLDHEGITTSWGIFIGTEEECQAWVEQRPKLKMFEFCSDDDPTEDGHIEGYIWNVVQREDGPKYLLMGELQKFLIDYYSRPDISIWEEDDSWEGLIPVPEEGDSWWLNRLSLHEFIWDDEQEVIYCSGRQPKY